MHFEWSRALFGLLVVPILVLLYVWIQRRKRKYAVEFASLSLIRDALPRRSSWRRHVPFALLLAALAALVFATARPQVRVAVPVGNTSIVLSLDVSRSMCSTDVPPNRLVVAQQAARRFVRSQPDKARIGLVAFAGVAQTIVAPTDDQEQLVQAIDELTTSIGTAIGSSILESIDALSEVNPAIEPSTLDLGTGSSGQTQGRRDGFVPDIIVLLTDGANTRGIDPLVAAQQAADRGVRIYTIGFGTENPGSLVCSSDQLGGDAFGNGFPDMFPAGISAQFLEIDEPTLRGIADATGGEYYRAEDADQLVRVFDDLPSRVVRQDEEHEITAVLAGLGALLALAAFALSFWWNRAP